MLHFSLFLVTIMNSVLLQFKEIYLTSTNYQFFEFHNLLYFVPAFEERL